MSSSLTNANATLVDDDVDAKGYRWREKRGNVKSYKKGISLMEFDMHQEKLYQ